MTKHLILRSDKVAFQALPQHEAGRPWALHSHDHLNFRSPGSPSRQDSLLLDSVLKTGKETN